MSSGNTKLVYSTEKTILKKERPADIEPAAVLNAAQQRVIVRLDRKGRGGKSVTIIEGLQMPLQKQEALLKQLKTTIGTGGTVKDKTLELQGDHCGTVMAALQKTGYRPKRAGG